MSDTGVEADDPTAESRANAEELARRAVARDQQAWGRIFDLHYRGVYAFIRYRLRGAEEAEDMASQVFEIAYSRADKFDYRGVPIEGWLIGIARNLVRDHVKKIGRRGYSEELSETLGLAEPDAVAGVDLHNDLIAAMHGLTEDQQEVIAHRFLRDRSVAETAVLMNRSEDAVKNLQRRALVAMHHALIAAGYPVDETP